MHFWRQLYKNRSSGKTDSQQEKRSSGSPILLKIVSENRFSGKTYFIQLPPGSGGGLAEEGELIEVVEMTVEEVRKLLAEPEVNATPVALYGLMW